MKRSAISVLVLAAALFGCGGGSSRDDARADSVPDSGAAVPADPAALDAAVQANLLLADKVDGAEDHVVSNCPGCSLRMEGEADHALEVGEYALHFCSDDCKDHFAGDLQASILALDIPEQ